MKRITAILLLSLYSLSTLGLSLKSFYCCGKLESVTVSITQDQQQKCSNSDEKSDCCKTKFQTFKVKDSHIAADHINNPVKDFVYLNLFANPFQVINYPSQEVYISHLSNPPPLLHTVPGYIVNCVFRV